jgi:hypothetical protein
MIVLRLGLDFSRRHEPPPEAAATKARQALREWLRRLASSKRANGGQDISEESRRFVGTNQPDGVK